MTLSPFSNQGIGTFPGQGIGPWQLHGSPLQQILQSLHNVPYQLQQLQQQLLLQDSFCVMAGPGFSGELTVERYLAAEHVAVTSRRPGAVRRCCSGW